MLSSLQSGPLTLEYTKVTSSIYEARIFRLVHCPDLVTGIKARLLPKHLIRPVNADERQSVLFWSPMNCVAHEKIRTRIAPCALHDRRSLPAPGIRNCSTRTGGRTCQVTPVSYDAPDQSPSRLGQRREFLQKSGFKPFGGDTPPGEIGLVFDL